MNKGFVRKSRPFIFSLAAVVAALLLRLGVERILGLALPPFIFFYPLVMLVAILAGLWSGLLTTFVSALITDYFVFPPRGTLAIRNAADVLALALFTGMGIFMSVVAERFRRGQARIAAYEKQEAVRLSEEERRKNEARLRRFFDTDLFAILYWEISGDVINVNDKFLDMTGYTREDLKAGHINWAQMTPPEYLAKDEDARRQIRETGVHLPYEKEYIRKDGSRVWGLFAAAAWEDNRSEGVSFIIDITERKRAEFALCESEERFRSIFEMSADLICVADINGCFRLVNPAFERSLGYSSNELLGRPYMEFVCEEDKFRTQRVAEEILQKGETVITFENRYIHKDGSKVWLEWTSRPADGTRTIAVARDITDRKRAETELEKAKLLAEHSAAQLRTVIENLTERVYVCDPNGDLIVANQAARATYGSDASATAPNVSDMDAQIEVFALDGRTLSPSDWAIAKVLRGEHVRSMEVRVHFKTTSQDVIISSNGAPVRDREGNMLMAVLTSTDITERKRAEEALRQSLERLEKVLDVQTVGVMFWDLNTGCMVDANDAFFQLMGYSRGEVEARELTWQKLTPPEYMDVSRAEVEKFLATGRIGPYEKEYFHKDGTRQWLLFAGSSLGNNQCVEFCVDISDRKKAEQALRESESRFRQLLESLPQLVWSCRADGPCDYLSPQWVAYTGIPAAEQLGYGWLNQLYPEDRERVIKEWEATVPLGRVFDVEFRIRRHDGTHRWFKTRATPIRDEDGKVVKWFGTNTDIEELKQFEEALRSSEVELRVLAHNLVSGVTLINAHGELRIANRSFLRMFDIDDHANILNINSRDWSRWRVFDESGRLLDVDEHPVRRAVLTRTAVRDKLVAMQSPAHIDLKWLLVSAEPILDSDGNVQQVICTYHDITARKQADEALRQSEQLWATTLQSIGDAVISTCAEGKIVFMNEVAEKLTEWSLEEAKDKDLSSVFDIVQEKTRRKSEDPVSKVLRLGKVVGLANHTVLRRRDGTEIPIEDSAAPIRNREGKIEGVVLVFHDVSEQRKIEKALRNSDRLSTTGRLAATIAHEIHNPLDAVGNLLFLINQNASDEGTRQFVTMASQELLRVTQMTQQMLTFQREAAQPIPVKIREIFDNVVALYERKIQSAGVDLKQKVEFDGHILALPGELRQVFANLVGNAIEAVGSRHGTITLRAYTSRDWRHERPGLRVVVADDGPGIPAEVRASIFEPFFTTKGESGTGLGLWITADILRKYDATIRLRTRTRSDRSGTCFSIFFPFKASDGQPSDHVPIN